MVIRLILVDDHPVIRAGLTALLGTAGDIEIVAEAASGREAVELVREHRPDVVLTDLRMPDGDGVEAIRAIRAFDRTVALAVLTTYETDTDILRAIEAGAAGYLLKDTPPDELITAVRDIASGRTILSPNVAGHLAATLRRPARVPLSAREREVLRLVADGLTNIEIGRALFITEATVKTHLLRIYAKLEVSDRTAAVTTAISLGEIDPA